MNMQTLPIYMPEPLHRLRTTEDCLFHWKRVVTSASEEWAKGFAKSIMRQSRRRGWQPTPKQLALMRTMVADLFADHDDVLTLIE